jgi:branched-subunit amino acid aminotransferase/4-amino-4-deoxychorismate lyase
MHHALPMQAWHWNGQEFTPCPSLPLADRGFRYGMALFESIRVSAGRPLLLAAHLDRLRDACCQRAFTVDENALQALPALLAASEGDVFARVYVTAGEGGPADPCTAIGCYVLLEPRAQVTAASYRVAPSSVLYHPPFGGLKTANYWGNVDALQQARAAGFDEALLFNENAELVSASMANVFVVKDGVVKTPSVDCGARPGVVREWVLREGRGRECSLFLRDLRGADEVFLTNSWLGLMPVTAIGDVTLGASPFTSDLNARYNASIAE